MAKITNQQIARYKELKELRDSDYSNTKKLILSEVELPEFYSLGEEKPVYQILVEAAERFVISYLSSEGGAEQSELEKPIWDNIEEAYDYVGDSLNGNVRFAGNPELLSWWEGSNSTMRGSIKEEWNWGSVFLPYDSKKKGSRLLLSHTDSDSLYLEKQSYLEYVLLAKEYEKNPLDYYLAWHFVDGHPAFWYVNHTNDEGKQLWGKEYLTGGKLWISISRDPATGKIVTMVESGSAVPPERKEFYHDPRLDVYTETYEQAIIELASLVHKFFDIDGSERPDVQYEKKAWEIELDKRLKELDDVSDSSKTIDE